MGATKTLERVAVSLGMLHAPAPSFETSLDVTYAGVLFALPALLVCGLLHHTESHFQLPRGYYRLDSIFLLLAFMALCRIKAVEDLRYTAPGEWGRMRGLDRIPEAKLRNINKRKRCCGKKSAIYNKVWKSLSKKERRQSDTFPYRPCRKRNASNVGIIVVSARSGGLNLCAFAWRWPCLVGHSLKLKLFDIVERLVEGSDALATKAPTLVDLLP